MSGEQLGVASAECARSSLRTLPDVHPPVYLYALIIEFIGFKQYNMVKTEQSPS